MTYRPPKRLFYEEHEYELLGEYYGQLPMYDLLGIEPDGSSTAGNHFPVYSFRDDVLYLDTINMVYGHDPEDISALPTVNGVRPVSDGVIGAFIRYIHIVLMMPMIGHIIIGRELATKYMNIVRSVSDFGIVKKITLKQGHIVTVEDISDSGSEIRKLASEIKVKLKEHGVRELPESTFIQQRQARIDELKRELKTITGNIRGMWI